MKIRRPHGSRVCRQRPRPTSHQSGPFTCCNHRSGHFCHSEIGVYMEARQRRVRPVPACCYCSICLENSSALVGVKPIASQPRCAHKFFFAVLCSAGPTTAWFCICRLPGVASNHASRCWKTSYPTVSQLRRSCILGLRLEPKTHQ